MQGLETTIRYYPQPKQELFHNDRYKIRHRACFCGVSAGKTICGLAEVIGILLDNPGAVAYGFEPTYKMVRRILIPTLESKYLLGNPVESNPLVISYHRSNGYLQLIEGQTFLFGSLEEPEYAEGANVDVIWIDEAQYIRRFAESQDVALRRLRGTGKLSLDITLQTSSTAAFSINTKSTPAPSPTVTPEQSPTPTVRELSWLVIVPLFFTVFAIIMIVRHRKKA